MDGSKVRLTRKIAGGCEDRNCPAVWKTSEPGMLAVQGTRAPAPDGAPDHEGVVLVPASMLEHISR